MCGTHNLDECAIAQAHSTHQFLAHLRDKLLLGEILTYLTGHQLGLLLVAKAKVLRDDF